MKTYKIAYATGSRADYGIVRNYLKLLNEDSNINLELLVTGSLLENDYGEAYKLIEKDGFKITNKVYQYIDSSSNSKVIKSMAIALEQFGDFFENNKYDLLIVLGDRYEMMSVSIAAAMNKIPILHIHGGEITLGNYDEFIRHSITKMSLYHFTSTEEYRHRVIQLGENPNRVFNIGAMGSENCKKIILSNVSKEILKLKEEKYFVVLFHPETLTDVNIEKQIKTLLYSISDFTNKYKFIFIGTNSDTGANIIRNKVKEYVQNTDNNSLYFENLHPDSYHYLLKNSLALIGNSSSGIIEAPTLNTYTINIGNRQKGRVKGNSIIDVNCNKNEIENAIKKILILNKNNHIFNPYFKNNSSVLAYKYTIKILNMGKTSKEFYDIN